MSGLSNDPIKKTHITQFFKTHPFVPCAKSDAGLNLAGGDVLAF